MLEVILASINWVAGVVVVAEALNKLERLNFRKGLRLSLAVEFLAWFALAISGGGAVIHPLLDVRGAHSFADVCALAGLATVILHCRYIQWRKGH
jgi:hypothetical protein